MTPARLSAIIERRRPKGVEISNAMMRALTAAVQRPDGNICPIDGVHAAAETSLLEAMDHYGFVTWDGTIPRVSDAGRILVRNAIADHSRLPMIPG